MMMYAIYLSLPLPLDSPLKNAMYCNNIYGVRNSAQYPNYLRLDLSLSRKTTLFGLDGALNFQFIHFLGCLEREEAC